MKIINTDQVHNLVCKNLKTLRLSKGESQLKFGDYAFVSNQQYCKYENGQSKIPACHLYLIAEGCSVDMSYFFQENSSE